MAVRWQGYPRRDRVQIPVYLDRWMMGDRYGEVTHTCDQGIGGSGPLLKVLLDKSGKTIVCRADDCTWV